MFVLDNGFCKSCDKPKYWSIKSQECKKCPGICEVCAADNKEETKFSCKECPIGFHVDPESKVCKKCLDSCAVCTGANQCTLCNSGYHFLSSSKKCEKCQAHCQKCKNESGICEICELGYPFSSDRKKCKPISRFISYLLYMAIFSCTTFFILMAAFLGKCRAERKKRFSDNYFKKYFMKESEGVNYSASTLTNNFNDELEVNN